MQGILATQAHGRGTGAIKGRHEFIADVFGLTHSDDDNFSPSGEGVFESLHHAYKALIKSRCELEKLFGLDAEGFAALFDQIHLERLA